MHFATLANIHYFTKNISIVYPSNSTRMNFSARTEWSVNPCASFCKKWLSFTYIYIYVYIYIYYLRLGPPFRVPINRVHQASTCIVVTLFFHFVHGVFIVFVLICIVVSLFSLSFHWFPVLGIDFIVCFNVFTVLLYFH